MIYLYTGTPGSGKSLHAANDVRWALNHDRPVLANFQLSPNAKCRNKEIFRYVANAEITPELVIDWADDFWNAGIIPFRENYLLWVADECQLLWNSRRWTDKTRMGFLELLSQHRKYGIKIIMIAQGAKMIDNQFRMLVETEVNHRKLSSMGFIGTMLSLPFAGRLFMRVSYLFQSQERLGSDWYFYRKKDADMYDSYARFRQQELDEQRKKLRLAG